MGTISNFHTESSLMIATAAFINILAHNICADEDYFRSDIIILINLTDEKHVTMHDACIDSRLHFKIRGWNRVIDSDNQGFNLPIMISKRLMVKQTYRTVCMWLL